MGVFGTALVLLARLMLVAEAQADGLKCSLRVPRMCEFRHFIVRRHLLGLAVATLIAHLGVHLVHRREKLSGVRRHLE